MQQFWNFTHTNNQKHSQTHLSHFWRSTDDKISTYIKVSMWQSFNRNCLSDVIKMSFQIKQSSYCCQPMTGYTGGNEKIGIVLWHCFELTCKLIQVFHVNWYSRQFHLTCHISLFACSFGVLLCLFCDSKTSIWILNPATLHPCSHASLRPFCVRLRL